MSLSDLLQEIAHLSPPGRGFKPHKYLLLLAVLNLSKKHLVKSGRVFYDETLKAEFSRLLSVHGGNEDRDRPYTPFFHLGNTSFWRLLPAEGRESELNQAQSVGGPGILTELVQYAEMGPILVSALSDEQQCAEVEQVILQCLVDGRKAKEISVAFGGRS